MAKQDAQDILRGMQLQASEILGTGGAAISGGLAESGVDILQGVGAIEGFLDAVQGKASSAISQILAEVRAASFRSFQLFQNATAAALANMQREVNDVDDRARRRAMRRLDEAGLPLGDMLGKAAPPQDGKRANVRGKPAEAFTPPDGCTVFLGEDGYLGRNPLLKPPGAIESRIVPGQACVASVELVESSDANPPVSVCILPDDSWLFPGECTKPEGTPDSVLNIVETEYEPTDETAPPPFVPQPVTPLPPQPPPASSMAGQVPSLASPSAAAAAPPQPGLLDTLPPFTPLPPQACPPQPPPQGSMSDLVPPQRANPPKDPYAGTIQRITCYEGTEINVPVPGAESKLSNWLGLRDAQGNIAVPPEIAEAGPLVVALWKAGGGAIASIADSLTKNALENAEKQHESDDFQVGCFFMRAILGFMQKWLTADIEDYILPYRQCERSTRQTDTPGMAEAIEAYIHGAIDFPTYACWVMFQNQKVENSNKLVEARRQQFTPAEALMMLRRGIINREQYYYLVRRNGWMEDDAGDKIEKLGEFIPPTQDVIRFMVRDTDDAGIVAKFGLDDEFDKKFGKDLAKFAAWQGVTPEVAKHYWRAHWSIPSFTQLSEVFFRNRKYGTPIEQDELYDAIRSALIQDDILPFWIPYLLSTTFTLPTRVDVKRLYFLNILDKQQVIDQFVKRGYSDDDARGLAEFVEKEKSLKARKEQAIKWYFDGVYSENEARNSLAIDGYNQNEIDSAISWAIAEAGNRKTKRCIAAVGKRIAKGLLDETEARAEMRKHIADESQVDRLVEAYLCERDARGKELPAAQLCKLLEQGIITPDVYTDRLQKLGYTGMQAWEMLQSCTDGVNAKRMRLAEANAKKQKADAEKAQKQIEKAAQATERQVKAAAAARVKAEKLRREREELRLDIAGRYAKKAGVPLAEALFSVRKAASEIMKQVGLKEYQALIVLDEMVSTMSASYDGDFLADSLAAAKNALTSGLLENPEA